MTAIDWNDGRLITMTPGDTATADGVLNAGQLFGLFFYNSAQNDTDARVSVVWSNSEPPVTLVVPGTTGDHGLASILFVSGNDTDTVSASLLQGQPGARVQAVIVSVKMPVATSGIDNEELPADGDPHPFRKFTRFFTVLPNRWFAAQIRSDTSQLVSVQFARQAATVFVVNQKLDPNPYVRGVGEASDQFRIESSKARRIEWNVQGDGTQFVWMNADSVQNSQSAFMSLQALSEPFERQV